MRRKEGIRYFECLAIGTVDLGPVGTVETLFEVQDGLGLIHFLHRWALLVTEAQI